MIRYRRLLVGLDLDERDETLIRYASLVSRMADSDEVRFVHVIRPLPEVDALNVNYAFHAAFDEERARRKEALAEQVEHLFDGPPHTTVHCEVAEGVPLTVMLERAQRHAVDLVIAGQDRDGGVVAEKLARKAPSSVLVVPRGGEAQLSRILVPVDFSEHAADAMDVAVAFAEAAGVEALHLLHVYAMPVGYFKLSRHSEAYQEMTQRHLEARTATFLQSVDLRGIPVRTHFAEDDDAARGITLHAADTGADLVVLGTRGRTDSAAILMGSTAEQVMRRSRVPVVAVKQKGSTLTLLEALLGRRRQPTPAVNDHSRIVSS